MSDSLRKPYAKERGGIQGEIEEHWSPSGGVRVNLGSGPDYREGWVNVDLYNPRADERFDLLSFPWPIETGSVDYVYADQILEHVPQLLSGPDGTRNDGVILFLREVYRILKPGGRAYIGTPHFADPLNSVKNITHYRHFQEESLDWMDPTRPGYDETVAHQAGISMEILAVITERVLKFGTVFNSRYHLPKYLNWEPNIGRPYSLVWVLRRPS